MNYHYYLLKDTAVTVDHSKIHEVCITCKGKPFVTS